MLILLTILKLPIILPYRVARSSRGLGLARLGCLLSDHVTLFS